MIRTGLLLAAGASRRFGADDKLLALLNGQPLIKYAADALRKAPLERRLAVMSNPALQPFLTGFELIEVAQGVQQSDSLAVGLAAAGESDRLLVTLGDMPLVTSALLATVLNQTTDDCPAASRADGPPMPPACFPRAWLTRLGRATGDKGAAELIRSLPPQALIAARGMLDDIDSQADLVRLEQRLLQSSVSAKVSRP